MHFRSFFKLVGDLGSLKDTNYADVPGGGKPLKKSEIEEKKMSKGKQDDCSSRPITFKIDEVALHGIVIDKLLADCEEVRLNCAALGLSLSR